MHWYITKIVFRIICGDGNHTAQFDEQLRLIYAETKEDAFYKAQALGRQEEKIFLNAGKIAVHWKFINVSELYKSGELTDGAGLYSRIEEREDACIYTETINKKASGITHSNFHKPLQLV